MWRHWRGQFSCSTNKRQQEESPLEVAQCGRGYDALEFRPARISLCFPHDEPILYCAQDRSCPPRYVEGGAMENPSKHSISHLPKDYETNIEQRWSLGISSSMLQPLLLLWYVQLSSHGWTALM